MAGDEPLFSFGLLADAQYADLPHGNTEGRQQAYREVPSKLRASLAALRSTQPPLAFVMHLGDIVNGNPAGQEQCDREFDLVATIFEQELGPQLPAVHVIGNHCLSVPRPMLVQRLRIPPSCYFGRSLGSGWRLVVLDTTEMSGHSDYPTDSEQWREAQAYVAAHPMSDDDPQMSSWNGGITQRQLRWLQHELAAADVAGERVLVASHHQLGHGAARATHMAWNWREVQQVLLASHAFRAAFAGHDHTGGYALIDGRHFVTVEGLLEAPSDGNAYAIVDVHADRLVVHGRGSVTSRQLLV